MSPDHITAGVYNRDIHKQLARNLVWLRETSLLSEQNQYRMKYHARSYAQKKQNV